MGVSRSFVIKVSLMQKYLLLILEKHYFGDDDPVQTENGDKIGRKI